MIHVTAFLGFNCATLCHSNKKWCLTSGASSKLFELISCCDGILYVTIHFCALLPVPLSNKHFPLVPFLDIS